MVYTPEYTNTFIFLVAMVRDVVTFTLGTEFLRPLFEAPQMRLKLNLLSNHQDPALSKCQLMTRHVLQLHS